MRASGLDEEAEGKKFCGKRRLLREAKSKSKKSSTEEASLFTLPSQQAAGGAREQPPFYASYAAQEYHLHHSARWLLR